jgi:hypothetical protein
MCRGRVIYWSLLFSRPHYGFTVTGTLDRELSRTPTAYPSPLKISSLFNNRKKESFGHIPGF